MASDSPWFESDHCFPTGRECVALLRELGRVDYIILSTHAYEHKLFIGPFSRKFPSAKVRIRIGEMVGGETDTTTGNNIIDVMRDIVSDEQCSDMKYVIFLIFHASTDAPPTVSALKYQMYIRARNPSRAEFWNP